MGSTYNLANHGERLVLADKIKDIFLISFKLRLNESVFYCLMIGICVEVCIFYRTPIKMVQILTLYFTCDPFCR